MQRRLDLRGGRRHNLHLVPGQSLNLFDQEQVGGFGDRDGQHVPNEEQRQKAVLFQKFARQ